MADVVREDRVEYPVESDNHVYYHCYVVYPFSAECEYIAEKSAFSVRVAYTPVHGQVPDGGVNSVYEGKGDEYCSVSGVSVDAPQTKRAIIEDGEYIFPKV